ncbi:thiolase-like protein [Myxozyma melibiosi]|uniref:3-oxoacyl-[acyl-carrier-protein] synthase n=1 Tax=Myxozyma melibiosi TaxID=54550 RepID=A0ABR1FDC4_9ASCO
MSRRVVITGLGLITPLGVGVKHSWSRLLAGESGITSTLTRPDKAYESVPTKVAGFVRDGPGGVEQGEWNTSEWVSKSEERRMGRYSHFALSVAEQALRDAEFVADTEALKRRTGVCFGTGIGNLDDTYDSALSFDKVGYKKVSPLMVPRLLQNMASGYISMKYGFKGPIHSVTTACTTGLHSIGDASRFIKFGDADVMVAGGAEACISPFSLSGFARAKSVSTEFNDNPAAASRPFDSARNGFVMGEGAGAVVLEELQHALDRGAKIYGEIVGYGLSGDAHHITAPPPRGDGILLSMTSAVRQAGIRPADIDYVNAHATSTPQGDAAENAAIRRLMLEGEDDETPAEWNGFKKLDPQEINISSTKGAIGHLLGAAGAVETIFSVLAMKDGVLPPTINLDNIDPNPDFTCNYVPNKAQKKDVAYALSNSSGFGGTNATLCLSRDVSM